MSPTATSISNAAYAALIVLPFVSLAKQTPNFAGKSWFTKRTYAPATNAAYAHFGFEATGVNG